MTGRAAAAWMHPVLAINLSGQRALVLGVADDAGYGFAIARALAEAGASVCVGTWPPAFNVFTTLLRRGKIDESLKLAGGGKLELERIYPVDVAFDTLADIPAELAASKRYRDHGDTSLEGLAGRLRTDFGEPCLDVVVHSVANAPEVKSDLLETSRRGYLAAVGVSAYSWVSAVQRLGPLVRRGGAFLSLSFLAAERVVPGYGGGMSAAKAALEGDTRTLAWEAGRRWGHRVNCISAGPLASRAAAAIGGVEEMIALTLASSPLPEAVRAEEVAAAAAFLCSPLASGITGAVLHVDKGFHVMGIAAPAARG